MTKIALFLLGPWLAARDGESVSPSRARRSEALLTYLACEPEYMHTRQHLDAFFFPDLEPKTARANLRQLLKRLRLAFGDDLLLLQGETVALNMAAPVWLDTAHFHALAAGCEIHLGQRTLLCERCRHQLQQASDLYRGAFSADLTQPISPPFETWLTVQQQYWQQQIVAVLHELGQAYERRGEFEQAMTVSRRLLQIESWHEPGQRRLMRLLARTGRRNEALTLYQHLCQLLQQELDVEPEAATRALYQRLKQPAQQPQFLPPARPLIGRQREVALLRQHLNTPVSRLLTVQGPGGSGKTALAHAVAQRIATDEYEPFTDGIFMLEIAEDGGTLTALLSQLAQLLDVRVADQRQLQRHLIERLRQRDSLLIIDNGEHLPAQSRAWLGKLTAQAESLHVLVTSRQRLGLRDETVLQLDGLAYVPAQTTASCAAAELFTARARQIDVQVKLDANAVATIACLTEGLPLALELAASWVRVLSSAEIATQLKNSLAILTTTLPDYPPRQRSMQVVLEHSWQLLDTTTQSLLADLTVFQSPFTLTMAAQLVDATPSSLAQLADYSLLQQRQQAGVTLYSLHSLLRQFLRQKAPISGELTARHSHYYADLIESLLPQLDSAELGEALRLLDRHLTDIRAGWAWAIQQRAVTLLGRYARALHDLLIVRGWSLLGAEMLQEAADLVTDRRQLARATNAEAAIWAALLARLGNFYSDASQLARAEQLLLTSQWLSNRHEDEQELRFLYSRLAGLAFKRGHWSETERLLTLCRQMTSGWTPLVQAGHWLLEGAVAYSRGQFEAAHDLFVQSNAQYEQVGILWGSGHALRWLGATAFQLGAEETAEHHLTASLQLHKRHHDVLGAGLAQWQRGQMERLRCRPNAALDYLTTAADQARTLGDERLQTMAAIELAHVYRLVGKDRQAQVQLQSALPGALALEQPPLLLDFLVALVQWAENDAAVQQLASAALYQPQATYLTRVALQRFFRNNGLTPATAPPALSLEVVAHMASRLLNSVEPTQPGGNHA